MPMLRFCITGAIVVDEFVFWPLANGKVKESWAVKARTTIKNMMVVCLLFIPCLLIEIAAFSIAERQSRRR